MNLSTHLHLVPNISMSGTSSPLPIYTFMLWRGATFPFTDDADRGQSVIAEELVQYQISMCGICGAQIVSGTALSPLFLFLLF